MQDIVFGLEAGVPISTYRFSEEVKVLLVENPKVPTVVEAFSISIKFVASLKETLRVPVSVKHFTPFQVSATKAGPRGMVVVPVQAVEVE